MKRFILSLLTAVVGLLYSLGVRADYYEGTDGFFYIQDLQTHTAQVTYKQTNGKRANVAGGCYAGDKHIPATTTDRLGNVYNVTSISPDAFSGCTNLQLVKIPSTVKTIGNNAFYGCTSLKVVTIEGSTLNTIGDNAFSSCNFSEIKLPSTVSVIGENAFAGCKLLTKFTVPTNTKKIEKGTFENCISLKELVLHDALTTIKERAFYGCSSLDNLDLCRVAAVGELAFYRCTGLMTLEIPSSLNSLSTTAFKSCYGIQTLIYKAGCRKAIRTNITSARTVTLPSSVSVLADSVFYDFNVLNTIELPTAVTTIPSHAFYNTGLTSFVVADNIISIGQNAFAKSRLTRLDYAEGCTTAFRTYATGLKEVHIPSTITSLGTYPFQGCTSLRDYHVASLQQWCNFFIDDKYDFQTTPIPAAFNLHVDGQIVESANITSVGSQVGATTFYRCLGLASVQFDTNVKTIGDHAFASCPNLSIVTLPTTVESIGESAFDGDANLSRLSALPSTLTSIGSCAFRGCGLLRSISIPAKVTTINASTFQGCMNLQTVSLPAALTTIAGSAFQGCESLTTLNVPDRVTSIGSSAFEGCLNLASLKVPDGVTAIEAATFKNCQNLRKLKLGAGVKTIGEAAMAGMEHLTELACYASAPPTCVNTGKTDDTFYGTMIALTTLYVPAASLATYTTRLPWKNFGAKYSLDNMPVVTERIVLDQTTMQLAPNANGRLTATIEPAGAPQTLEWESSNPSVVDVLPKGLSATIIAYGSGSATITARATDGSGVYATCAVTVESSVPVTSVSISKTTLALTKGQTSTLTATCVPSTADNKTITWTSSQNAVATVSDEGLVTAVGSGTAVITAQSANGKKATCTVTVTVPVTSITLNQTTLELTKNEASSLTATCLPADATNATVSWTSSKASVATVDANGRIVAIAPGTATITAAVGSVKATCTVTVVNPVTSISLRSSLDCALGDVVTLVATCLPEDATNATITWTSNDTGVATVTSSGVVTAKGAGTATITAKTANGVSATCVVTVTIPVTAITISSETLALYLGDSQQLTATCAPANASNAAITWTSSNESVATVSEDGLVTAAGTGTATIYASSNNNITATCTVTVTRPTATEIRLFGAVSTLKKGEKQYIGAVALPETSGESVKFTSNNTSVIQIDKDSNGPIIDGVQLQYYLSALATGEATITASSASVTKTFKVKVENVAPTITLNESIISLQPGEVHTLVATVTPAESAEDLQWIVENARAGYEYTDDASRVLTVENGIITAVGPGTAIVYAQLSPSNRKRCYVTVENALIDGLYYAFDGTTASVTTRTVTEHSSTCSGKVTIPSQIHYAGKTYTVTKIGAYAFQSSEVQEVVIPNTVTEIGNEAFSDCKKLKHVDMPSSIRSIGQAAFNRCEELEMTVPEQLDYLGYYPFGMCPKVTGVINIPEGTEIFLQAAFANAISGVVIPEHFTLFENLPLQLFAPNEHYDSATSTLEKGLYEALTFVACLAEEPAPANAQSFNGVLFDRTILYVPAKSIEKYRAAEGWNLFEQILPYGTLATSLTLPEALTLEVGQSQKLTATIAPADVTYSNLEWTSGNERVAVVDDEGVVTIVGGGKCTITARTIDGSDLTASCVITAIMKGDVTRTGMITSADVSAALKFVLGQSVEGLDAHAADYNGDGVVRVTDVMAILRLALNGTTDFRSQRRAHSAAAMEQPELLATDGVVSHEAGDVVLPVALNVADEDIISLQFDVVLSDGTSFRDITTANLWSDHEVVYTQREDGTLRVICFSMTDAPLVTADGAVLHLRLNVADGEQEVELRNIELVHEDVLQTIFSPSQTLHFYVGRPTSVEAATEGAAAEHWYDLLGRRAADSAKGMHITNGKVVIK